MSSPVEAATTTGNRDTDPPRSEASQGGNEVAGGTHSGFGPAEPILATDEAIEVDSLGDSDSAYGDSLRSELTSITSSIYRGVWENGRRYHSYGKAEYAFPNDEPEAERLDLQHAMQSHLLGDKLFWAPIDPNLQAILDLGTGTGIWAIEMADAFPSAEVTGTDLSPMMPSWVPPNCKFEIDDAENEWTWKEASFDYIHNRNFVCAIRDWPKLIAQSFRHVKPGGWVEWHEKYPFMASDDNSLPEDSHLAQWSRHFFEASKIFGTDANSPKHLKQQMHDAGFVDVQEHILKIPTSPWARDPRLKRIGRLEFINMTEGIQGLTLKLFSRALGWTPEQVEVFLAGVRKDVMDYRNIHCYYSFYVVFGRRPEQ